VVAERTEDRDRTGNAKHVRQLPPPEKFSNPPTYYINARMINARLKLREFVLKNGRRHTADARQTWFVDLKYNI
jgi:hypothetical protein